MSNKGFHLYDIDATVAYNVPVVSDMEEGQQVDKFALVLKHIQNLSDKEPFRPEWMFNEEMPEELRMYLRNIFQQRIKGISSEIGRQLSDDDLIDLTPHDGESLSSYTERIRTLSTSVTDGGE